MSILKFVSFGKFIIILLEYKCLLIEKRDDTTFYFEEFTLSYVIVNSQIFCLSINELNKK